MDDARSVVSHPCTACDGRGDIDGDACSTCKGTGVTRFYHGTKANLKAGDLIAPGHGANFGKLDRTTIYVYFTGTVDAARVSRFHPARIWTNGGRAIRT